MHESEWTSGRLLEMSGGYWGACALHAGVKLELFSRLGAGTATAESLVATTGFDRRGLSELLRALCALGLLELRAGAFANTPFARAHLDQQAPAYLGHILLHHHHLMSGWSRLHEAVQNGKPVRPAAATTDDAKQRESFLLGMFNLAMNLAPQLVPRIDLSGRRRLLDLGGGPGTYAAHFCLANPDLQGVVYDLPTTRPFAEKTLARFALAGRVTFVEGDYLIDEIPGTYDVVWLSHILHGEGLEGCRTIIAKAVRALQPGGMIIVQDFILDDDGCGPLFPALFSLNMVVNTEAGRSYREGELKGLLAAAGVGSLRRIHHDLPGHTGLITGTVP